MQEKFDAIIVGAGPAGCAAAYTLAKAGLQVLVVERGKFVGAKNMMGGVLYGSALHSLIPNFWEEAPVERHITRHVVGFLSPKASLSIDFSSVSFDSTPYNAFTVLRAKFDRWFAAKAGEVGAIVATGLQADDLLWDGNRVVGIVAGGDEIPADVVIAADGVNSILAEKAGLRGKISPDQVNQGVKEVIKLPREVIEERFNLVGDSGTAMHLVGFCTKGVHGGGFDLLPRTVQLIHDGFLDFTIDQQPYVQGFYTVVEAFTFLASGGLVGPANVNTGLKFVTKGTVDPYLNTETRYEGKSTKPQIVPRSGGIKS